MSKAILPNCAYVLGLSLLAGCAADRAVVLPWDYAPPSPTRYWNDAPTRKMADKNAAKMEKKPPPAVPDQKDPLSLAEVIDLALRNNTQTRQTWAEAREAAAKYGQSQQNFFPLATASYNFTRIRELFGFGSSSNVGTSDGGFTVEDQGPTVGYLSQWGPLLSLSYLIFDFGKTRATSKAALFALYNANLTHNREIETVVQTITSDYYNYLYQDQLLIAYVADIDDAKVTLKAAEVGLKAGVRDVSDVLQARSQLLQLETEWVNQKQTVKTAYAQLLTDAGLPATMDLAFEQMPDNPKTYEVMSSVNELISLALEARSDLVASEANFASAQQTLEAARRNMLPTISGNFDIGRTDYSGGITDHYDFVALVSVSWSIFNGFFDLNNIKYAKAAKELSKAILRQTELNVIEQVTTAHFGVAVARDALRYSSEFLKAAFEEYDVTLRQYKAGTKDILTVTTAQSNLANARATKANALQQWFVSLSTLGYATGVMEQDLTPYLRGNSKQ
jgi:outer membrane protein